IPYLIVGGVRFYERREIKDLIAYLRLLVNPLDDIAFRRGGGAPARGLGQCGPRPRDITPKPRRALEEFARLIARLHERRGALAVPALIDEVAAASGYRETLKAERTAEAE